MSTVKSPVTTVSQEMLQQLQLAAAHEKRGEFSKALAICEQLLQRHPNHYVILHYLGTLNLHIGQPQKSLNYLQQAIKKNPRHTLSYNYAGIACCQLKEFEKGISYYKQALKISPNSADIFYNLGIALSEAENFEEASSFFRKAEQNNFVNASLFYNLAYVYEKLHKFDDAIEYYQKALHLNPNYEKCIQKLADLSLGLGFAENALILYERLQEINPSRETLKSLALTCTELNNHEKAIEYLLKAYDEKDETIFLLLANSYNKLHQHEKQIAILQKGLELFPKNLVYLIALNSACRESSLWDEMEVVKKKLAESIDTDEYLYKDAYYYILGYSLQEELKIARKIASYYENKLKDKKSTLKFRFSRKQKNKLRIGYLSGNIKNHANTHGTMALFPNHDRNQFEVYLYSVGKRDKSIYAESIIASVDHFVDLYSVGITKSAEKIYEDDIDVLVDLTGYHNAISSSVLTLHPGKIQIGFSGHCGTRGADFIEYMFTDRMAVKEDELKYYHEKLIFLPDTHFIANSHQDIDADVTRQTLNLPKDKFIFTCFNLSIKYDGKSFKSWMNILKKVPNSVILLWTPKDNEFAKNNIRKTAMHLGVEPERILFAEALPKEKHLGRLQNLDLFLDAFSCTAHVTCVDAMLVNLPLLTVYGGNVSSRGASSILTAIDLPELITYSVEEFEEKAVYFATHPDALNAIRNKIAVHRSSTPLFDSKQFVNNLEKGYLKAWELFVHNKTPETFFIE